MTATINEVKLKPCPICGSKEVCLNKDGFEYYISCLDCGLTLELDDKINKDLLVNTWNNQKIYEQGRADAIDEFVKELLRYATRSNPYDTTAFVCKSSNEIIRMAEQLKENLDD